jgi:sec-independent protein translocase protein TatA
MGALSISHLLVVLVIALLLFGAGRVSEVGKGLGEGIRNFKKGLKEEDEEPPARAKRRVVDDDVEVMRVRDQLAEPRKKKIIQIEVDDDADDEEVARRIAAKKKEMAAEHAKAS